MLSRGVELEKVWRIGTVFVPAATTGLAERIKARRGSILGDLELLGLGR